MNRNGFAPVVLLIIIGLALIGGGAWYYKQHSLVQSPSSQPTLPTYNIVASSTPSEFSYKNNLLGYEVAYPFSWRIAADYTEQLYILEKYAVLFQIAGCPTDSAGAGFISDIKFTICVQNALNGANASSSIKQVEKALIYPGIAKSDLVVFTDLKENDEQSFLEDVKANKKTLIDFPFGHAISIYPSTYMPPFQTHEADAKVKVILRPITLKDGIKAEIEDDRISIPDGNLFVYVPHATDYQIYDSVDNQWQAEKSLAFMTNAKVGSDAEKVFYDVVNTLRIQ